MVPPENATTLFPTEPISCVFCTCGSQRWGVRLSDIRRIIAPPPAQLVAVPYSPPWLLGACHVDVDIVTALDPAHWLEPDMAPEIRRPRDQAVLLVEAGASLVGLVVSALSPVTLIPQDDFRPAPESHAPYLFAAYAPQRDPDPLAAGASGLYAVRQLVRDILRELGEEIAV